VRHGQISFSSRVIPVVESLNRKQWVLPAEQAMEILRRAKSVAVQNCECRSHYQRCDNPLAVCLLLNDVGEKLVSDGKARPVSLAQAAQILRTANEKGLVHLSLYMSDHEIYALCRCCSCCCHDVQIIRQFQRKELMVRSQYLAGTDCGECMHCGACIERCIFGARAYQDEKMAYRPQSCVGCGRCVTICPAAPTTMVLRESQEVT
jgi:uncharacterized Fe-S center protein